MGIWWNLRDLTPVPPPRKGDSGKRVWREVREFGDRSRGRGPQGHGGRDRTPPLARNTCAEAPTRATAPFRAPPISNISRPMPREPPVTRAFVLLLTHCPVLSSLSRMSGAEEEMTHDGPRTNGEVPRTTATPSRTAPILPDICYTLRRKVTAFLEQPSDDQLVRDTQAQARVAMGVIKEALQSYTYHPPPHHPSYPQTNPPTATTKSPSPTTAAKTASSSCSSSSPASRPPRSPHHRANPPPHPRSPSPRNASKQSTSRRPTPSRKSRPSSPPRPKPTTSISSATRCPCAPRSRRTSATGRRCAPCSWARGGRIRTANFWSILARRMGIGRGL